MYRHFHLFRTSAAAVICCMMGAAAVPAHAGQMLSLKTTGGATSASITEGTTTPLQLDLYLNTGGQSVGSIQYYLQVSPVAPVTYAAPVVTALGPPHFVASDLFISPVAGAAVAPGDNAEGFSVWIKESAGDYAAFDAAFARYTFDTSALPDSATPYDFVPVFSDFANSNNDFTPTFDLPGAFSLTVTAVPEPMAFGLTAGLIFTIALLGRRSARLHRGGGVRTFSH